MHFETQNDSPMTAEVYSDIKNFIFSNIDTWRDDAKEYDYIDLTIGVSATENSDKADSWGFQTGDNSYTGGAYGHPYWGVASIFPDSDPLDIYNRIIEEIEDQLCQ